MTGWLVPAPSDDEDFDPHELGRMCVYFSKMTAEAEAEMAAWDAELRASDRAL